MINETDVVFEKAAQMFAVLSIPLACATSARGAKGK
jgi:hypothetical protein